MRRPLFDETTGEWLQGAPEAAIGLQRLLCKPLKHLWQDSPESRVRDGAARWSPAVSEYRQVELQYPLQHAAQGLLTAEPPQGSETLQEATLELASTGRWVVGVLGSTMAWAPYTQHLQNAFVVQPG